MSTLKDILGVRGRLSVDAYHKRIEKGDFAPDDRIELIRGQLVKMVPVGPEHAILVERLNELLLEAVVSNGLKGQVRVRPQLPLVLDDHSEVSPDFVLLSDNPLAGQNPHASSVLLLIEICDFDSRNDRLSKLPSYASAGVPEVWMLDVTTQEITVTVYQTPEKSGYMTQFTPRDGISELTPQKIPRLPLKLGELTATNPHQRMTASWRG